MVDPQVDASPDSRLVAGYRAIREVAVAVEPQVPPGCQAVVVAVAAGARPDGVSPADLQALDFAGKTAQVAVVPGEPATVLVGLGDQPGAAAWRDAVAAGVRAVGHRQSVAVVLTDTSAGVVRAVVEGALLARYAYDSLRAEPKAGQLRTLSLVAAGTGGDEVADRVAESMRIGREGAAATALSRDLANTPHNHMTASTFAALATELAGTAGIDVQVWDRDRIRAEGLGGVLAINAGSAEPPRVIRLEYTPQEQPTGHLALVGKGIMYDSGGIGLKPNDDGHSQMKNDMTGAACILAAMIALPALRGSARVTGWLMCTDNMPSSTATALGDVVTVRGGATLEIIDTDAEGRVVMADGIVLSTELRPDAIVDIATLTGSVSRALGPRIAGTVSSTDAVHEQIAAAAALTGEGVWRLPLATEYRHHLDSPVADIRNVAPIGIPDGLIAALFLHSFTGSVPWGHIDIAGTAWSTENAGWRTLGCSGFGARLLSELAGTFQR